MGVAYLQGLVARAAGADVRATGPLSLALDPDHFPLSAPTARQLRPAPGVPVRDLEAPASVDAPRPVETARPQAALPETVRTQADAPELSLRTDPAPPTPHTPAPPDANAPIQAAQSEPGVPRLQPAPPQVSVPPPASERVLPVAQTPLAMPASQPSINYVQLPTRGDAPPESRRRESASPEAAVVPARPGHAPVASRAEASVRDAAAPATSIAAVRTETPPRVSPTQPSRRPISIRIGRIDLSPLAPAPGPTYIVSAPAGDSLEPLAAERAWTSRGL